jgi:hypothetical protein
VSDEATEGDEVDAIWARVIDTINDIIQQRREPLDAASELDELRVKLVRLEAALRPFVEFAAGADYDSSRRDEIRHEILIAAETFRRRNTL